MNRLKGVLILLWIAALALAAWVFSQLPLTQIVGQLRQLNMGFVALWLVFNVAILLLYNYRWWLINGLCQVYTSFWQLFWIRQAGQSISFITPGPQFGGEPLQIFWLHRQAKAPVYRALAGLGIDRLMELWVNFCVLLMAVLLLATLHVKISLNWEAVVGFSLGTFCLISLGMWSLIRRPQRLQRALLSHLSKLGEHRYLRTIKYQSHRVVGELGYVTSQHKSGLLGALSLSFLCWISMFAELMIALWLANVTLDLGEFLLLFVGMRLALLLPLPGGVGTLEAAIFWVFQSLQLPLESALTLIALMRLRDVSIVAGGLFAASFIKAHPPA